MFEKKLKKHAFANSLAATGVIVYAAFYVLLLVAPGLFEYLWRAQFLGSDAAGLMPGAPETGEFIGILVTMAIMMWLVGYVWALLYNKFAK